MTLSISPALKHGLQLLLISLALALQSCGSGSDGTEPTTPFTDPFDAQSLGAALVTDAPDAGSSGFWQCILNEGEGLFSYQLKSDGTGIETDLENQNTQSELTWQATSATTLTTTFNNASTQLNFTNVQFSGTDRMSLMANENLALACERNVTQSATPVVPASNNSLSYGGVVTELTHGFEESFSYSPTRRNDTHSLIEVSVADALFRDTIIQAIGIFNGQVLWRPNDASVWFRARLYSPGGEGFETATFTFEPESTDPKGNSVSNRFFFQEGRFGVDIDEDGTIDSDANEFIDVSAGTITLSRLINAARMSFDVTLTNGVNLTGSFEGVFPLYENI